jgi:REP element-mobilizing transposase RayT
MSSSNRRPARAGKHAGAPSNDAVHNTPGTAAIPGGSPDSAGKHAGAPSNDAVHNTPGTAAIPGGSPDSAGKHAGAPSDDTLHDNPGGRLPDHKSWYSRGYLPHLDHPGLYQSITFRLHDSLPEEVVQQWKEELHWRSDLPSDDAIVLKLRRRTAEYEDASHGACWLRDERIAKLVEHTLLFFDGQRYRLVAWCIMPNHVHVFIETYSGYALDKILHSWKSFTAQRANELLARAGPFWARDYYDRYIRDEQHFMRIVAYIEENPVKAGFVKSAEEWKFGSAARKAQT